MYIFIHFKLGDNAHYPNESISRKLNRGSQISQGKENSIQGCFNIVQIEVKCAIPSLIKGKKS